MATAWTGLLVGCTADEPTEGPALGSAAEAATIGVGLPLAGITADEFTEVSEAFASVEDIGDGLGPIFNERACGNCHFQGALGGAGTQTERRFGRFVNGRFDSMSNKGGSLRQLQTNGDFTATDGRACSVPTEVEPDDAQVSNVGRITTPLFGLGLVDSLSDNFFDTVASLQPAAIRGNATRVPVLLANPDDPGQQRGVNRVGRFGHKGGVATLFQFSADAYVNEMGITTQSCVKGASVVDFATESAPNGIPQAVGCDDLANNHPAGAPAGTDDAVGPCAANQTTIQDDVEEFATFMTFLAPVPQATGGNAQQIARGAQVFDSIGCDGCHLDETLRTPATPGNGVPGNFAFKPYSDFLTHDMGNGGDFIGNDGDAVAVTRRMRTAPLWGNRFRTQFMHDGRAANVSQAIAAHQGQAAGIAGTFSRLAQADKDAVLAFVKTL